MRDRSEFCANHPPIDVLAVGRSRDFTHLVLNFFRNASIFLVENKGR